MGHASARAALIYQHRTDERDREIADGIDARIKKARNARGEPKTGRRKAAGAETGEGDGDASGTDLARGR